MQIGRLRTHEVGELKSDGFVVATTLGGFQLQTKLVELDGEELDGHVAVKALGIGPALHTVTVGQLLVDGKECVQLVVVDVTVLESTGIYHFVYAVEYLIPLAFVLLD